jgi:hypothetical protein
VTSCRARSGVSRRLFTPAVAAFPISHRIDARAHPARAVELESSGPGLNATKATMHLRAGAVR